MPLRVVSFAIIPNELNMIKSLLNSPILPALQLVLHLQKIHRMFDYQRVIIELQLFINKAIPSQSTGFTN